MQPDNVPVISIEQQLWHPKTLDALERACRNWGFFQVTDHGIDRCVIGELFDAMHRFFALPAAQKRAISV